MWISPDTSWVLLEPQLLKAMEKVDWIGELPIEQTDFDYLAAIIRHGFTQEGKLLIERVKPATFVTSMVFAARYSHEYARNFWTPYALQVWGLKEASQHFQKRSREYFQECAHYLRKHFGFSFPRVHLGDVVRPIYRHAVIPFHLEKDFVEWLKSKHAEIADLGEGSSRVLRNDPSVRYLPPTLRGFLQDKETVETAFALIRDMVTAVDFYLNEGETAEDIRERLDYSPIRRVLWDQLRAALDEHRLHRIARGSSRAFSTQIEWIWSFRHEDLVLRLRNLAVESEAKPSRVAWVEDKDPLRANLFDYVYPYAQGQGRWLIDEVILPPDEDEIRGLKGNLVLIGEDQSTLESLAVPAFTKTPLMFFRLTQQQAYGIEVNYESKPITDGDWALSMAANVVLLDEENREIHPIDRLPVPLTLAKHAGHTQAGIYNLRLPVTIKIGGDSFALERQTHGVSSPILEGKSLVPGLSPYVPPVFTDHCIWLRLSGGSQRLIELGRLSIKAKSVPTRSWSLKRLEDEGYISLEGDVLTVSLERLLPDGPALVILEVYQGLYPALPSPLQIALLPGIQIVPPNPDRIFGPNLLPSGWISGVALEQIVQDPCLDIQPDGNGLRITWRDLRPPCTLRFNVGDEPVTLAWEVNRVCAWLEPQRDEKTLTLEEIQASTLNLRAPSEYRQGRLWIEGETAKRQIDLGARGHYRQLIQSDPLYDMIRKHRSPFVTVWAELAEQTFSVVEVRQRPELHSLQVGYDPSAQTLAFSCDIDFEWPGLFTFRVRSLANPDAEAITVGQTDCLRTFQTMPCKLEPDLYLLEIMDNNVPLLLDQTHMLVAVGKDHANLPQTDIEQLSPLTNEPLRIPGPGAAEFLREVAARLEDEVLSALCLYQLATLPGPSYTALSPERLRRLWEPLAQLALVQRIAARPRKDLLPAWAVLGCPLRLTSLRNSHIHLTVYPEKAMQKGLQGVGYSLLMFEGRSTPTRVYVRWGAIAHTETILVKIGQPDEAIEQYAEADEWAMWPIYQCAQCGHLVDVNLYKHAFQPGLVRELHLHHKQAPLFIDTLIISPMQASVHPQPGEALDYQWPPTASVDRDYALQVLKGAVTVPPSRDNPISQDTYRHATAAWIARYRDDMEVQELVDHIIAVPWLAKAMKHLEDMLIDYNNQPVVAYQVVAGRLLAALRRDSPPFPAAQLDQYVLETAVLLRSLAYRPVQTESLLREIGLDEDGLIQLLESFDAICPELLSWALTWIELFYLHAAS